MQSPAQGSPELWFWERITSPHVAGLLAGLARRGCRVVYVTEEAMSRDRVRQGWSTPSLEGVESVLVRSRADVETVLRRSGEGSIHLCDGVRGAGLANVAQVELARLGRQQWVMMETVDDAGWQGVVKRVTYRNLLRKWEGKIRGVLAIGHSTAAWVVARGVSAEKVYPFAYFLPAGAPAPDGDRVATSGCRIVFVGQLVERKRLAMLLQALARLRELEFQLTVVGGGPLEAGLRRLADRLIPDRVTWSGAIPMAAVGRAITESDCLVLPSRHDGWGAVVSEALLVGTPVICSDRCGAAGVVRRSGAGGVFGAANVDDLAGLLRSAIRRGRVPASARAGLANWATCLDGDAGADYLLRIIEHDRGDAPRPVAPWEAKPPVTAAAGA